MKKKAVVLLSGGIDSTTTLYAAKKRGYDCHCLIFDYGQKHKKEIGCAERISKQAGCKYRILRILLPWKGSSLIDKRKNLPKGRSFKEMAKAIPSSYVPARNTIFLSFALSLAEAIGAGKIFIGANSIDYSGYPDCRDSFLRAFQNVIREGTKTAKEGGKISIEAPLLFMTKSEIIKEGVRLKVPYGSTWSCYEGLKRPCGRCDSCVIRKRGFEEAWLLDPTIRT